MTDELSKDTRVHLAFHYKQVIREIKNLEEFYEAKVLAAGNIHNPKVFKAKYGTKKMPVGPRGVMMHLFGPDGTRLDGEKKSSDGS